MIGKPPRDNRFLKKSEHIYQKVHLPQIQSQQDKILQYYLEKKPSSKDILNQLKLIIRSKSCKNSLHEIDNNETQNIIFPTANQTPSQNRTSQNLHRKNSLGDFKQNSSGDFKQNKHNIPRKLQSISNQSKRQHHSNFSANDHSLEKQPTEKQIIRPQSYRNNLKTERDHPSKHALSFPITAQSWALFDTKSGKLIDGKHIHNQRNIASLTKIMTLYTSLKLIQNMNLDDTKIYFSVSKFASKIEGTTAELKKNHWIRLIDLYYALMLPSGNDASIIIAENIGGIINIFKQIPDLKEIVYKREVFKKIYTQKVINPMGYFVTEMNKNAKFLGMKHTIFANPHGMDHNKNKSTAYDMGILCCRVLRIEKFCKIVSTIDYSCEMEEKNNTIYTKQWQNTNKLLGRKGWYGIKTGITPFAGPCMAASFQSEDTSQQNLAVILLNSESMEARWDECEKIVNWQLKHYNI